MTEPTLKYDPEVAKVIRGIHDYQSGRGWSLPLVDIFTADPEVYLANKIREEQKKSKKRTRR